MKYYKSKDFYELESEWYHKLKEDGFKDIESRYNGKLDPGPLRFSNYPGYFFENRLQKENFFRVIGVYIHHSTTIQERHKIILEYYIEYGSIPKALELSGSTLTAKNMWNYLQRNFPKMLTFVNKLDNEAYYDEE